MQLEFRGLTEGKPAAAWRAVVRHGWPGWRDWYLGTDEGDLPSLAEARRALRRHMPEMERLWDELLAAAALDPGNGTGNDDLFARFLSFWMPPRYLVGCSQLVLSDDHGPVLIRNYDLDPRLNEATMLATTWRGGRVLGMVEGLAGLADGMNEAGLAASLAFGGRVQSGRGFGIPLIMRYVLETCRDVRDAREALRTTPCHMSYNVTVADRSGDWATVLLAPDRPAVVTDRPLATNHQIGVEWPYYARLTRTEQRAGHLGRMQARRMGATEAERDFLSPPLYSTDYARGFGTVYTASYRPASGEARLAWPDGASLAWNIADFKPAAAVIAYGDAGARQLAQTAPQNQAPADPAPKTLMRLLSDRIRTSVGRSAHTFRGRAATPPVSGETR